MNPLRLTKQEILAEVALSRDAVQRDSAQLRYELDFASKIKRSVRSHGVAWLSGAALAGYFFAGRRSSSAKPSRKRGKSEKSLVEEAPAPAKLGALGLLIAAFRFLFPIFKPMLSAYAARRLSQMAVDLK